MSTSVISMAPDVIPGIEAGRNQAKEHLEALVVWATVRLHAGGYAVQKEYRSWADSKQMIRKCAGALARTKEEQAAYESAVSPEDLKKRLKVVNKNIDQQAKKEKIQEFEKRIKDVSTQSFDQYFPAQNHAEPQFLREWPTLRDKLEKKANDQKSKPGGQPSQSRIVVERVDIFLSKSPCLFDKSNPLTCSPQVSVMDVALGKIVHYPPGCLQKFRHLAKEYESIVWNVLFDNWHGGEKMISRASTEMANFSRAVQNLRFYWMGYNFRNPSRMDRHTLAITRTFTDTDLRA